MMYVCLHLLRNRALQLTTTRTISIHKNVSENCACLYVSKCASLHHVLPVISSANLADESKDNENKCLQEASVDLSTVTPYFPQSYSLAAYVNKSETLQNLVRLNVNLSKIEKKPYIAEKILRLDFERDIMKYIQFLKDYVDMEIIGNFITRNPMILYERLEDLEVRINYLQSKSFESDQISRIVSLNPFWLMFSTLKIDRRLGFYQREFHLSGKEVRSLATKCPKIITYKLQSIKTNSFAIKEEMGFNDVECKELILKKPRLWIIDQKHLLARFNYIHNIIKIDHKTILKYPGVLLSRLHRLKQRHLFLEKLGRAQYDSSKTNYVPLIALVEGSDVNFCQEYAKCNISDFNVFLKTL